MKYWCFKEGFGLENLMLCEADMPSYGPSDVLIEMQAASLNYRDLVVSWGQHGRAVQPPVIPLSDGVGVVIEVGIDVTDLKPGDRVMPSFFQNWKAGKPPLDLQRGRLGGPLDGVLATHRVFPAANLVLAPGNLTNPQAATLPCAGTTAWSALSEPKPLRLGETVLIQGTGGVALMALSLAKAAGAWVIMTTSTEEKVAALRARGADEVVNRNVEESWAKSVIKATQGRGCDRVLELGGAATLNDSVKAVSTGGTIVLIGNVTGSVAQLSLPLILTRHLALQSVSVGSQQALEQLSRAIETLGIAPEVDRVFSFEEAPDAFRALEGGGHFGNVCISCNESS